MLNLSFIIHQTRCWGIDFQGGRVFSTEFFQAFGYAEYTGPLTVAMIAAGLVVALKGYSDRGNRLDTPYTKDKRGNGFNSY